MTTDGGAAHDRRRGPRDPEATRRLMRAVKRTDTKPELLLRRAVWRLGLRYRLHDRSLPGSPDLVFRRARVVVFVDGDFWHGRKLLSEGPDALAATFRESSRAFWSAKIAANIERDRRQTAALAAAGWTVVRVWERDVVADPGAVAVAVAHRVRATHS